MSSNPPDDDRTVIRPGAQKPQPPAAAPLRADDDDGNALPPGTLLGDFRIERVLGQGGFGIVYLCQDLSLPHKVAIKEYMPSELAARRGSTHVSVRSQRHQGTFQKGLESFVNEAHLLAQFDHPSLVKVYRFWEANGTAYMVMPFYKGMTLKDRLQQLGGPPDEAWLMRLLAPLTEALAVIHAEHCYHRDIAPDNIILREGSGVPLLLDFGAARKVIGDMTHTPTVMLKEGYAPLEQYGEIPGMDQGPWTDVYGLAAVMHFAITGRKPAPSIQRLLDDRQEPLARAAAGRYSDRFLAAIDRGLAVRPEQRTRTMDDFRQQLGLQPHGLEIDTTRPAGPGDSLFPPGSLFAGAGSALPPDPLFPPRPFASSGTGSNPLFPPQPAEERTAGKSSASGGDGKTVMPLPPPPSPRSSAPQPLVQPLPASSAGRWIGIGLVLLVVVGGGAFYALTRPHTNADRIEAKAPSTVPAPAPSPATVTPPTTTRGTDATGGPAPAPASIPAPTPPLAPSPSPPVPSTPDVIARPGLEPPMPAPWSVNGEFDRIITGATSDIVVSAMAAKDVLRVGKDRLSFTVKSSRDGYVYVLMSEPGGSLMLFYPNKKSNNNKLAAGRSITMPQSSWLLDTTEPTGDVQFLVIVSESPRDFSSLSKTWADWFLTLPLGRSGLEGTARCAVANCDAYGATRFVVQIAR